MKIGMLAIGAALLSQMAYVGRAVAPDPEALPGARVYQARCGACHSLDANKIGPAHRGVYGRPAGSARDFVYSGALKSSGIVWNDRTLDLWLQGPQKLVPGSRMYFSLSDAKERAAVIGYLKATSGK